VIGSVNELMRPVKPDSWIQLVELDYSNYVQRFRSHLRFVRILTSGPRPIILFFPWRRSRSGEAGTFDTNWSSIMVLKDPNLVSRMHARSFYVQVYTYCKLLWPAISLPRGRDCSFGRNGREPSPTAPLAAPKETW
jgi:hypothetical protein